MIAVKHLVHKIIHWEYWPQWLVYAPIMPIYLYYAAKNKNVYFPLTANPFMENGGYLMESKYTIYTRLAASKQPATIYITRQMAAAAIVQKMKQQGINFPCIVKPNIGGKGMAVKLVQNINDVVHYQQQIFIAFLLQEKINYNNEVGIFYARLPNENTGCITGIVAKKNMVIKGNGINTLKEMVNQNSRLFYQQQFIKKEWAKQWNTIIPANTTLQLSCIGNHARGSQFFDVSHKNNALLTSFIDDVSKQFNTFYFGRYDIMFDNWADLSNGKNLSIIELNGSGSEPTHIYDTNTSLLKAWKIIIHHWRIAYQIAEQQIQKGIQPIPYSTVKMLEKQYKLLVLQLQKIF